MVKIEKYIDHFMHLNKITQNICLMEYYQSLWIHLFDQYLSG